MSADSVAALCEIADEIPELRRLILFVSVAVLRDVWPMDRFLAEPPSDTDGQSLDLFHRVIRSIPEPDRVKVWHEVDAILEGRAAH